MPQIAAMADNSYKIAKHAVDNETVTGIVQIKDEEVIDELARMLGSDQLTETVRENAKELVNTAKQKKEQFSK